jgi:hypothetical protein
MRAAISADADNEPSHRPGPCLVGDPVDEPGIVVSGLSTGGTTVGAVAVTWLRMHIVQGMPWLEVTVSMSSRLR